MATSVVLTWSTSQTAHDGMAQAPPTLQEFYPEFTFSTQSHKLQSSIGMDDVLGHLDERAYPLFDFGGIPDVGGTTDNLQWDPALMAEIEQLMSTSEIQQSDSTKLAGSSYSEFSQSGFATDFSPDLFPPSTSHFINDPGMTVAQTTLHLAGSATISTAHASGMSPTSASPTKQSIPVSSVPASGTMPSPPIHVRDFLSAGLDAENKADGHGNRKSKNEIRGMKKKAKKDPKGPKGKGTVKAGTSSRPSPQGDEERQASTRARRENSGNIYRALIDAKGIGSLGPSGVKKKKIQADPGIPEWM
ncbi:hypothetical protein BDP27DRAFT_1428890 [Rhodocollybia butyracea]|uniref:Uncharacterized protein n=1 Tax=Rhodocollybia butyracea TaxID=206335 RepID=A0A9P5PG59_9AGAR|nr:hypothetical protein BDP27DRAFT_1428890 [Rhodocollybia butyracea]